jgi:Tol biopolymer transport system component
MVALGVLGFLYYKQYIKPEPVLQVSIDLPAGSSFGAFVDQRAHISISPDGRYTAFSALSSTDRKWRLWLRSMDESASRMVPGIENVSSIFWSPDSQYLAFFADQKLKKIQVSGGPAQTICDAPDGRGGSWSPDGTIIFAPQPYGPLYKVSATGGHPTQLTKVEKAESSHRWPFFLPDGKHFLFTGQYSTGIYAASLDDPRPKKISSEASNAMFVKPDTILFARDGNLLAQKFDPKKLTTQ